jgi:hypothetical protein
MELEVLVGFGGCLKIFENFQIDNTCPGQVGRNFKKTNVSGTQGRIF